MNAYAILDNKLYTMSADNLADFMNSPSSPGAINYDFTEPTGRWDEHDRLMDDQENSGNVVFSVLDVNNISLGTNYRYVDEVLKVVRDNKLTEMKEINPAVKIAVTYAILDASMNVVESKVSKVTVGTMRELLCIHPITPYDDLYYTIAQHIRGRVVIGSEFRALGISKSTRSASRVVRIDNVVVSVSTTDRNIYSEYLSKAQTEIGWTPTSPTQEQVAEYDIPIFNLADSTPGTSLPKLPHYTTIPNRSAKVYLDVNLKTSILAFTYSNHNIDDAVILNQRKLTKYTIAASTDSHSSVDQPEIRDIAFGTPVTLKFTADTGYKFDSLSLDISRFNHATADFNLAENGNVFINDGMARVTLNETHTSFDFVIGSVEDFYKIVAYTTVSPIIPAEGDSKDSPTENPDGDVNHETSTSDSEKSETPGGSDSESPDGDSSSKGDVSEGTTTTPEGSDSASEESKDTDK